MELTQLVILASVSMAGLAALRLVRVLRFKRTPLPDGPGRIPFMLAFALGPPFVLAGRDAVPLYLGALAGVVFAMWVAAAILEGLTSSRAGQLARLALVGTESDPIDSGLTPVTARLSESMQRVAKANDVFPRGVAFAHEIDRPGFRDDWDALQGATEALEVEIAEDHRLGLGVSASATALAEDARSRLDTLRRLADGHGQSWTRATA